MACGGHPPPVLLAADGTVKPLECTGTLLGVLEDPLVHDVEAVLAPGDTLLLYTDGLTEAGAPARTLTTEDVGELLRLAHASHARETVANCLSAARSGGRWRGPRRHRCTRRTSPIDRRENCGERIFDTGTMMA